MTHHVVSIHLLWQTYKNKKQTKTFGKNGFTPPNPTGARKHEYMQFSYNTRRLPSKQFPQMDTRWRSRTFEWLVALENRTKTKSSSRLPSIFWIVEMRSVWLGLLVQSVLLLSFSKYAVICCVTGCNYREIEGWRSRFQPSAWVEQCSAAEFSLPAWENPSQKQTAPSHRVPPLQMQLKIHKASMLHRECRARRYELRV